MNTLSIQNVYRLSFGNQTSNMNEWLETAVGGLKISQGLIDHLISPVLIPQRYYKEPIQIKLAILCIDPFLFVVLGVIFLTSCIGKSLFFDAMFWTDRQTDRQTDRPTERQIG